jgi:hypothetical protein
VPSVHGSGSSATGRRAIDWINEQAKHDEERMIDEGGLTMPTIA